MDFFKSVNTSHFITDTQLFYTRACLFFVTLCIFAWTLTKNIHIYFSFFTNLSWIGLFLYFSITFGVSIAYRRSDGQIKFSSERMAWWAQKSFEALFVITETCAWIVFLVYWILLSGGISSQSTNEMKALLVLEHSIDLILILIEMFVCKIQIKWIHSLYPIAIAYIYVFYTWIMVYSGVWSWPYSFFDSLLNPVEKVWWMTVLGILGGTLAILIIFSLVYFTFWLREYIANKRLKQKDEREMQKVHQDKSSMQMEQQQDSTIVEIS